MVTPIVPNARKVKELTCLIHPPQLEHVLPSSVLPDPIQIDQPFAVSIDVREIPTSELNAGAFDNGDNRCDVGDAAGPEGGRADCDLPVPARVDVID
jgi:hypothetical protein